MFKVCVYLKDVERKRERGRSSTFCFRPVLSQESGIPAGSPMCVVGTEAIDPSPVTSKDALLGSWNRSGNVFNNKRY